jgi:predicted RNA-binding protein with TRAM domain
MKIPSTKKRFWQIILIALSITTIFGSCQDTFDEMLGICPEVESTNPADKATGVQLNKIIAVKFNEAMNPASIKAEAFSLRVMNSTGGIDVEIPGKLTYDATNNTMNFAPNSPLAPNITYTGRVEPIVSDVLGNVLQAPYVWTFTTGSAPTVTATNPANMSTGNALNKPITAKFSAKMNPETIKASSFTIKSGTTAIAGVVSYTDSTATFTPSADLLAGTTYTGTITVEAKNTDGIPLASEYTWTFNTGAAPSVVSVDPKDQEKNVAVNNPISAVFSEMMDPSTINASSFTLKIGLILVPGAVTYSDLTAVFKPFIPLMPGTIYTATISKTVKNPQGISITSDFVWSFTTAAPNVVVAPLVTSTDPTNNAVNVGFDKVIKANFSITMDPATITGATFMLKQGNTAIAGTVTYAGNTASFTPSSPLSSGAVYTATITTGAKSSAGVALENNYAWNFTTLVSESAAAPTVTSTDPTNNAVNIAFNKVIKATFSQAMDPATITASSFTLKQGNTVVAGTVTYSGNTASFTPNNPLSSGAVYTATITTDAKNTTGTALATNYVWNFTTVVAESATAPTVTSTDPANNDTGVALNKVIKATFSQAMNPATITGTTFTLKQGNNTVTGTVAYSGNTASFTPNSTLSSGLVYTATITTGAKNTDGTALANNYVWNFTTLVSESATAPTVTSTDPANNDTGVALNKVIKATFSQAMNPATITGATFTLKQGNNSVTGSVTYSGNTASFTPNSPLSPGLVYTATITTGAENTAGTGLANNYVWTFTTAPAVAPTVTSTDPANNATNVPLNKVIKATFSEAMDPATITGSTFTLKQGNTNVTGTVTYSGTTASFTPTNSLSGNLVYTATITTGAKNTAGTALANDYVWTFTTAAAVAPTVTSTDPANNATNVPLNKVIKANFSEAMDPATITGSTFTLKQGNTNVTGTVTYSGTTASFTPTNPLSGNLVYTATITTGAKNTAGTALANDYVWTFTTAAAVAPTVTSTDPVNNATNVPLNKVIKATFSEPMNPATITGSTFTLKQGSTNVTGTVTYSGTTASFTPNNPLSPNVTYTATITTGAQNLAGTGLANDYVWTFQTLSQQSSYFVDLKTAGRFGIFAATGISNNAGFSQIRNLDVGITPGARSSVTGFPPATIVNGAIYASDDASPAGVAAMLIQAKSDLTEAYLFAEGATSPAPVTVAGDQGGKTLAPGIYKSNSTLMVQAGDLTLDAQGDPNAVWIFQIASGFTTVGGAGGNIILSGGAQASNIFWQVGSSATIGDNTKFKGNVLALTSITMNSNATVVGRMLVINGAVVMTNTNIIEKP